MDSAGTSEIVSGPSPRSVFEFLIGLFIAISLLQTFVVEAYLVPTGSMAPSLLGFHAETQCPVCGRDVVVGTDTQGQLEGTPTCNNCGARLNLEGSPVIPGDRLLVHKWFYSYKRPERWETVVFCCPDQPRQAYVKRVVGLPGESVQISQGNIFINGTIARKSLEQFEKMGIPVFELRRRSGQVDDRWVIGSNSAWRVEEGALHYTPVPVDPPPNEPDFLFYQHRDPQGNVAPVGDQSEYSLSQPSWIQSGVQDLVLRCRLNLTEPTGSLTLRLHPIGTRQFDLWLDFRTGFAQLDWNQESIRTATLPKDVSEPLELVFGYFDERVVVRIGDLSLFEPFDLPVAQPEKAARNSTPIAIGSTNQAVWIDRFEILRDVYYSSRIAGSYNPAGVAKPYKLAEDQYFVLGDNSPISHDSRAWEQPAVPTHLLLGKPVFVHLPSRGWQIDLFGRRMSRPLPDVSKIRRIH